MSYIIKLTGSWAEGRSVDGEYDGGETLVDARAKAAEFAERTERGRIAICRPIKHGTMLSLVEEVRAE